MIISYVNIDVQITPTEFENLKRLMPKNFIVRNDRYHRQIDRQRNLFGLLLLARSWQNDFNEILDLEMIQTSSHNRPFLADSPADFNISHSGDYVVCILSPDSRVGIDIELQRKVNLSDFSRTMNQHQWTEIQNSDNPFKTFFEYWCMKESVIKADGRGLSIPLTEIAFEGQKVIYDGNLWHLSPFKIDRNHPGCVASNTQITELYPQEVHWKEFLE